MSHSKHAQIAREIHSRTGLPYQQALEAVRAGRDYALLGRMPAVVYVVGFVHDNDGNGGFEWRVLRADAEAFQREMIEADNADVSDVVEVSTAELDRITDEVRGCGDWERIREALTEALDWNPELWEPRYNQNRKGTPAEGDVPAATEDGRFACNPGHPDALARGCSCTPQENRHGAYTRDGGVQPWSVMLSCPLHSFMAGWTARQARYTDTDTMADA